MISMFLLCLGLFQSVEEFAPRVDTLRFHLERLAAITIPESLEAAKATKIARLREMLAEEIVDEQSFNVCYTAMDEVRQWLWANAAQRPTAPEGRFEETEDAWRLTTAALTVTLHRETLARQLAFREMTDHQFLDNERRRQQTRFSDGTSITVDFNTREYVIEPVHN